jgi:hypothetical protein
VQLILDLFGHRWHIISDVSCIPEDEEEVERHEVLSSIGFGPNDEEEE